jgi:hypothetical protein
LQEALQVIGSTLQVVPLMHILLQTAEHGATDAFVGVAAGVLADASGTHSLLHPPQKFELHVVPLAQGSERTRQGSAKHCTMGTPGGHVCADTAAAHSISAKAAQAAELRIMAVAT